jgi:hypothetical protein
MAKIGLVGDKRPIVIYAHREGSSRYRADIDLGDGQYRNRLGMTLDEAMEKSTGIVDKAIADNPEYWANGSKEA